MSQENNTIHDELNKIQIEQLHKATLNFSDNSLETKKLCVAVLSGVFTIIAGINKDKPFCNWVQSLALFGMLIPFLFYIVDAILWFYQSKLREKMINEENQIRKRYGIVDRKNDNQMCTFFRIIRALFNGSQTMYYGLIVLSAIMLVMSNTGRIPCE